MQERTNCAHCGESFTARAKKVYCSDRCRLKAHVAKREASVLRTQVDCASLWLEAEATYAKLQQLLRKLEAKLKE